MDFNRVETQLNDLPATFRRQGTPFTQLTDSLSALLTRMTMAADGTIVQGNFKTAQFGWLDTWGQIVGILRGSNVPDITYAAQLAYAVLARGGPALAITGWIYFIFGIQVELIENLPNVGYTIIFPGTLTVPQIQKIVASIDYVRPAGIPFTVEIGSEGTFIQTVNFLNAPKISGAYLATGTVESPLGIPPSTNNAPVQICDLFLVDLTLNPVPPT